MSEANKQAETDAMDDWGSALAEQASTQASSSAPAPAPAPTRANAASSRAAGERVFPPLQGSTAANIAPGDIDRVMDVPVQLTAELGRTRITIKSLLALSPGSVVELDGLAGEPMDVFINGYLIAQGEVVVVNEKFGIRLTDIVMPAERMQKLNR
ncbi:MAG: flagellar motor switch protein FliN [Polaromonas sp. 39-63-203]|jgi:flagellar motor switch protein FliN/FliY|uniref:flagellar motor switch protein FliN n=1 Tax=Polaromonas sp. TaxID=1869339 RepID=UPI000BC4D8A4|nr:flagellar motor switch protein FliN [Polaromonas sp.]OYY53917.1 MAG: flagellar motor switch protein FliN [Polaromonas sp. 35-63-240]OYZ02449.1 MAG: flagellar motor switch protein FliN [Polaromonas sp. 28-63-22]OYZ84908.1 MAG: flagellar motor switch protein FliN [Polaromonas sp. 24-62-144]OZA98994.1 MAG: flagellar motor switch protein FliN [Polaromonas sp. 39-63-203]HQS31584.1 flagellar motor switch protein FliN [Polaromonas sp.]